ncbi:MAG: hypothetical protein Q8N02_03060 [Methylotenera sp.]|nr:hypothetical protein [Methylotenera sp.]MDO9232925.1 hypothetical protein [Methylotenera sp.]MDO9389477.1 hypothetical protein [Methylotenera sp.]MDP2100976.1 hypothetical protein [Methylotenera sp.]MDP2280177.1 hypothetical protein [Methylotenera sp.]
MRLAKESLMVPINMHELKARGALNSRGESIHTSGPKEWIQKIA